MAAIVQLIVASPTLAFALSRVQVVGKGASTCTANRQGWRPANDVEARAALCNDTLALVSHVANGECTSRHLVRNAMQSAAECVDLAVYDNAVAPDVLLGHVLSTLADGTKGRKIANLLCSSQTVVMHCPLSGVHQPAVAPKLVLAIDPLTNNSPFATRSFTSEFCAAFDRTNVLPDALACTNAQCSVANGRRGEHYERTTITTSPRVLFVVCKAASRVPDQLLGDEMDRWDNVPNSIDTGTTGHYCLCGILFTVSKKHQ